MSLDIAYPVSLSPRSHVNLILSHWPSLTKMINIEKIFSFLNEHALEIGSGNSREPSLLYIKWKLCDIKQLWVNFKTFSTWLTGGRKGVAVARAPWVDASKAKISIFGRESIAEAPMARGIKTGLPALWGRAEEVKEGCRASPLYRRAIITNTGRGRNRSIDNL